MLLISLQYEWNNEEGVAEESSCFCDCLAGEKCNRRQCYKVQVNGGQNEKMEESRPV